MDNLFRYRFRKSLGLCGIALLIALSAASLTQRVSAVQQPSSAARELLDPEGKPLPFRTNQAVEIFLQTAQVISSESIGEGITRPRKVLLEKDGVRMHAEFSDFHEERNVKKYVTAAPNFLSATKPSLSARPTNLASCWDSTTFPQQWRVGSEAKRGRCRPGSSRQ